MNKARRPKKTADAALFKDAPPSIKALHKVARKGLRLKARATWWQIKQAQQQAEQDGEQPNYSEY